MQTRFIIAGGLIDGTGSTGKRQIFLTVEDGIITAIQPVSALPKGVEAQIDDFSHCTIIPPLVDCSVSLTLSPSVDLNVRLLSQKAHPDQKSRMLNQHIRDYYSHGVLGVADTNSNDLIWRYCKKTEDEQLITIRTSSAETDTFAPNSFLRIPYSHAIDASAPSLAKLDHPPLAKWQGAKTVIVANGTQPVREAIEAGCDAIEQGYAMGENNLHLMAENNILWIPSVIRAKNSLDLVSTGGSVCCRFSGRYIAPGKADPESQARWQKIVATQLRDLGQARTLGIQTSLGTGAGNIGLLHGESMVEEMKLFMKAGYSLEQTIACASDRGASFFNMSQLGTLTVGQQATFLLTRGTAKQLPRKLSYLEGLYINGMPSEM